MLYCGLDYVQLRYRNSYSYYTKKYLFLLTNPLTLLAYIFYISVVTEVSPENKLNRSVARPPPKLKLNLQQVDEAYWANRHKMLYLTSLIMVLSHRETEAITFVCFMPS